MVVRMQAVSSPRGLSTIRGLLRRSSWGMPSISMAFLLTNEKVMVS